MCFAIDGGYWFWSKIHIRYFNFFSSFDAYTVIILPSLLLMLSNYVVVAYTVRVYLLQGHRTCGLSIRGRPLNHCTMAARCYDIILLLLKPHSHKLKYINYIGLELNSEYERINNYYWM